MQDAKKPYTEVAKKAFVSGGTVHVRMNKLEEAGIVEKTTLKVNYAKLGYDITAFIGIFLQKSALYDQVMAKLKAIPEITNIHYTTGNYSMFTKIHCKDTNHLKAGPARQDPAGRGNRTHRNHDFSGGKPGSKLESDLKGRSITLLRNFIT